MLALDPAFSQDDFGFAVACIPESDDNLVYLEHVSALRHPGFNEAMDHAATMAKNWAVDLVITDHGEFRTRRVVLELYDEIAVAKQSGCAYQTRLNPVPAGPSCCHAPTIAAAAH